MLPPHAAHSLRDVRACADSTLRLQSMPVTPDDAATRTILQADALEWMRANAASPDTSVITSLPDVSELTLDLDAWKTWFTGAARDVMRWIPADGVAIFYQSDIRHRGLWVDKSYLVMRAIEMVNDASVVDASIGSGFADHRGHEAALLWHKIVCRKPPGSIALGRPSYSHMLCVAWCRHGERAGMRYPGPDVLSDAGASTWARGMGENACRVACRFVLDEVPATKVICDPFCGRGSVLAMAESMGFATIGIDISAKRCRAARRATVAVS